jgi:hypothetical protein
MVHSQISQHRNGNIFHNPIKKSEAPDYYDIVKRPMDLKTIKAHIREGQIASSAEFQRDVYLMFANSLMYNRPGSDIYTMAEEVCLALHDFFRVSLTWTTDDVGERGTNQHLPADRRHYKRESPLMSRPTNLV